MATRRQPGSSFSLPLMLTINELAFFGIVVLSAFCAGLYLRQERLKTLAHDHILGAHTNQLRTAFELAITNPSPNLVSNILRIKNADPSWSFALNLVHLDSNRLSLSFELPELMASAASNQAYIIWLSNGLYGRWQEEAAARANVETQRQMLAREVKTLEQAMAAQSNSTKTFSRDRLISASFPPEESVSQPLELSFADLRSMYDDSFSKVAKAPVWTRLVKYTPGEGTNASSLRFVTDYVSELEDRLKAVRTENDRIRNFNDRLIACTSDFSGRVFTAEFQFGSLSPGTKEQIAGLHVPSPRWEDLLKVEFQQNENSNVLKFAIQEPASEGELRKELLGLKGTMSNVVFVVDISGSMNEGDRWPAAKQTITNWIHYLPIQNCALVCFNHLLTPYPDGKRAQLVSVSDTPQGHANRQKIAAFLQDQTPTGFTDTPGALTAAYAVPDIDTIILFTDGRPASKKETAFDSDLERKTHALIKADQARRKIPINVVGIGNYFEKKFGSFLQSVSTNSGGTFIGR